LQDRLDDEVQHAVDNDHGDRQAGSAD
jgi:hypothetical protein